MDPIGIQETFKVDQEMCTSVWFSQGLTQGTASKSRCWKIATFRRCLSWVAGCGKVQIFEFRPGTKDLCSLNNLRGGLFSDKIYLDANKTPPWLIENFKFTL